MAAPHDINTEQTSELNEEGFVDEVTSETSAEDAYDTTKKRKQRRLAVLLSSTSVLAVVALIVGIALTNSPATINIEDEEVPLSSLSSGTSTSATALGVASSSGNASSGTASEGADTSDSHDSSSAGSNPGAGGNGGSNGSSGATGSGGYNKVWHEAWDEQVWVDTSGWQSAYVGENPIYQEGATCNECGYFIAGSIMPHMEASGHYGYRTGLVQIGTEPIYENQWVSSGYWTSVHHEGYWS